jgi:hypothetical protein
LITSFPYWTTDTLSNFSIFLAVSDILPTFFTFIKNVS